LAFFAYASLYAAYKMSAASAEHVSHPLRLLVAGANSHGDTGSTIVTPAMRADDNEALPPTLPTVLVPSDPTRTADSVAASTSQPAVVSGCFRAHERYEILGEHGRGGLGRVSRARDHELGRDIAIKELICIFCIISPWCHSEETR
jgi:hypothetical protein